MSKSSPLTQTELIEAAQAIAVYFREEADFNRSWIDGRRLHSSPMPETYNARRAEIAAERERWAEAVERLLAAAQKGGVE